MRDIFVARQPIFDARQRIVAYELLYRSDGETAVAGDENDETMTSSVLVNGVLGMGLAKLTEGQTAFINLSESMLFDGTAELLDPHAVVIELLESIRPSPKVVAQCAKLAGAGYKLALDDFEFDAAYAPLLEIAEYVKVDLTLTTEGLAEAVDLIRPFGVKLLAEKVEDQEMHDLCVEYGFELFQGYHYFKPETVSTRDSQAQSVSIIRLMNMLRDPRATDRSLEDAFRSDPALTYKLLRIVNSAALGGRGVDSIPHALRLLGRDPLYRWLCLMLVSIGKRGGDVRVEIIKATLQRARMCEILGDNMRNAMHREIPSPGSLFLAGLFAEIDQLVGTPLEEILDSIHVSSEVRAALLDRQGHAGSILRSAEAYAAADWESAEKQIADMGGDPDVLPGVYLDAVTWAGERVLPSIN